MTENEYTRVLTGRPVNDEGDDKKKKKRGSRGFFPFFTIY
jgi:hypothetical protein